MHIDKAEIVAVLRSRGMNARADWVERVLPGVVDADRNGSLLKMLDIDPATMSPVAEPPLQG